MAIISLPKQVMLTVILCAATLGWGNTVFFDSFEVTYQKGSEGFTVLSDRSMRTRVHTTVYSSVYEGHSLLGVYPRQELLIWGHSLNVEKLEEKFSQQEKELAKAQQHANFTTGNILNVFNAAPSNAYRKLLAVAAKGTGTIDYKTFIEILSKFTDNHVGPTAFISLFSDVTFKNRDESRAALRLFLEYYFPDHYLVQFYKVYQEKCQTMEVSVQRALYARLVSDNDKIAFLHLAVQHTHDFYNNPYFYIEQIKGDDYRIKVLNLLANINLSGDNALAIINRFSSNDKRVEAAGLLDTSNISVKNLINIFDRLQFDIAKIAFLNLIFDRINLIEDAQHLVKKIVSNEHKIEAIKILQYCTLQEQKCWHQAASLVNNFMVQASSVEGIMALEQFITSGEQVIAIIGNLASDDLALKAIEILKNKPLEQDHIVSLIQQLETDMAKQKAVEILGYKVVNLETVKTLMRSFIADTYKIKAVKTLFDDKRIKISPPDIMAISQIISSDESKLHAHNFLLDLL